ncbi:MAG: hypothetical protein ONB24_08000 [candidate division KSB1 bacterium]|nr:hypothetical protein [candidate division KSB1 bacterium]
MKKRFLLPIIIFLFLIMTGCRKQHSVGFDRPTGIYINWASYDELSDTVKLDESIAMRQLYELIRLRKQGVQIDYYLMDAFWFDPNGGYREWRKESWPNGPELWLKTCKENGIIPGLWLSTNVLGWSKLWLNPAPAWQSSLNAGGNRLCLFEGGYLPDLIDAMQMWVDRGVGLFKFDFADFENAYPPHLEGKLSREEIFKKNVDAFRSALLAFRRKNPHVRIIAYNGFGGQPTNTGEPFRKTVDLRWLDAFDAMYCGDPRLADVPAFNFWRSKDIYSDHMVRQYEFNGLPLDRIDNSSFMIGTTGTCYGRRNAAWKGMLVLSLARGGWANTYYGNLELLTDDDARWFAKAQALLMPFQQKKAIRTFGAIPGTGEPYGYIAQYDRGGVIAVVNPQQAIGSVTLPVSGEARLLFADAGFTPTIENGALRLGPEQLALVGIGAYAGQEYDLGRQEDVVIPQEIEPIPADFQLVGKNHMNAVIQPPAGKDLRIVWRQFDSDGLPKRAGGDYTGRGTSLGQVLLIRVEQQGRELPVEIRYDKKIWSGLSWAVGEVRARDINPNEKLVVRCISMDPAEVRMECRVYSVIY